MKGKIIFSVNEKIQGALIEQNKFCVAYFNNNNLYSCSQQHNNQFSLYNC